MARSQARDGFGELSVAIILLAWDNLNDETIASRLAELIVIRLRLHYELFPPLVSHSNGRVQRFSKELASNPHKRQILLSALIHQVKDPNRDVVLFLFGLPSVACSEDVPWLLDLLVTSADLATKTAIAELVQRIANWRDRTQLDAILKACDLDPVLSQTLTWLVNPVALDTPAAKQMKARYLEEKEFERRRNEKLPPLDPPPYIRIQRDLNAIEAGDLEGWVQLSLNLTLKPDSRSYETPFNPNLRNTPGWDSADAPTRARILNAALQYLISHIPNKEEWLGKSLFHWRDFSGYKALQLLFEESPSLFNHLDSQVWSRWATVILVYPTYTETEEKLIGEILRIAYPHARDELSSTIGFLLDQDIRDGKHVFLLKRVIDCWNSSIASVILERAKNKDLDATTLRSLLDALLSRGVEEARTYAKSLMSEDELTLPDRRARVVSAAVVLIQREQDAGWPLIWPMIKHNVVFGKEVLEATAFFPGDGKSFLDRLNEERLGNLYAWLVNQYGDNDQAVMSAGFSNPSHTISMLEHGILNSLKARGNFKSVAVLTGLVAELPQIKWLKFYVLDAQNITRRQTWVPLNPTQFLALSANTQSRIVQNAGQLLNVVIESLQRLQTKLHAEVPAVEFLWIPTEAIRSSRAKKKVSPNISRYI